MAVRDARPGGVVDGYQPALDGVRALAVAAVVLFHAGVPGLPGGFLGVDAFFVLSGFLITGLLLDERHHTGGIRLAAFWGRRARRLLPALFAMLLATALAGRYLLGALDLRLLRGDELAALGYAANWRMIYRGGDYFTQTAAASPVQHTWSLGIEEQFYLLWPLIVGLVLVAGPALLRRHGHRALLALALAGTAASAVAAALLYQPGNPDRAYFGTDTRAQALLTGCVLALLLASPAHRARPAAPHRTRALLVPGLAVLGAATFGWLVTHATGDAGWLYRGGLTGAALAVAAVLACVVTRPRSVGARLLGLAPLAWLGRISYGVYLWHWPLFGYLTAARTGLAGTALLALRLVALLAVALVSYAAIEAPVRRGRWWRARRVPATVRAALPGWVRPALAGVLAAGVTALGIGAATAALPAYSRIPPVVAAQLPPPTRGGSPTGQPTAPAGPLAVPILRAGRLAGTQPRIDIFGDSVAWTIGTYLPAHPGLTVATRAIEGCGLTLLPDIRQLGTPHRLYDYCPGWPGRYQAAVAGDDPDVSVLLVNRWELMDAKLNGVYQHVGQAQFDAYLLGQLDQAVRIVSARGARVVLLTAAYTHRAERPDGGLYDEDQPARVDAWNALLRTENARRPAQTLVLDLNALVCPGGRYADQVAGVDMRSDGLHFTPAGVHQIIAPWLLPQLRSLALTGTP